MNPHPKKLQVLQWLPTRWVLTRGSRRRRVLYLTFDDGPHPEHTPVLLDLLAKHRVRATFYLIGQQVERHAEVVRRIVSEGHGLGNHSWSHPHFDRLPLAEQRREIEHTERLLARFDGLARHDFRPPRGVMPVPMVLDCIRRGRRIAFWSYDSLDPFTQDGIYCLWVRAVDAPGNAGVLGPFAVRRGHAPTAIFLPLVNQRLSPTVTIQAQRAATSVYLPLVGQRGAIAPSLSFPLTFVDPGACP